MKLKFNAVLALVALCGAVFAAEPAKKEAPKPPAPVVASETDEIDLDKLDDSADAARKAPTVTMASPVLTNAQAAASSSTNETGMVAEPIMPTGLVDISCDDATLADILRQFRKTTGANIISGDSSNLQQRISVSLKHVPWLDALQAILNTKKFRLEPRGDIYFVSEDKQIEPIFTKTFALNHASRYGGQRPQDGQDTGPADRHGV